MHFGRTEFEKIHPKMALGTPFREALSQPTLKPWHSGLKGQGKDDK